MKYIIYCGPGIGDFVMMLPIAKAIKEKEPNSIVSLFSMMNSKGNWGRVDSVSLLLKAQCYIDDIGYYSGKEWFESLRWILRKGYHTYDVGIVLQSDNGKTTSFWPCRIVHFIAKKTAGMMYKKRKILYDYNFHYNQNESAISQAFKILNQFEIYENNGEGLFDYQIIKQHRIESLILDGERVIGFCVGSAPLGKIIDGKKINQTTKNWFYDRWMELAIKFVRMGYKVIIFGGKKEKEEIKIFYNQNYEENIINLAGQCTILESIWAMYQCELVIGVDTGMMHCAGAANIPSLTLFGCTSQNQFLAYGNKSYYINANECCSPCYGTEKSVLCQDRSCMKNISVEDVYIKALSIIRQEEKVDESKYIKE